MAAVEEVKRQREREAAEQQSHLLPAMRTMIQPGIRMNAPHARMMAIHDKVQLLLRQAGHDADDVKAARVRKRALEQSVAHRLRRHWLALDRRQRESERDGVSERLLQKAAEAAAFHQDDARKLRRADHVALVAIYSQCLQLASSIDDFRNMITAHGHIAFHQCQSAVLRCGLIRSL